MLTYTFIGDINTNTVKELMGYITTYNKPIHHLQLNISSLGGSVAHAITLYNFLKSLPCEISTHNLGEVTSAAVLIYLAGSTRTAEKISKFIMHPIKLSPNGTCSYFQLQEMLLTVDADIKNYGAIVNNETNLLNGLYDIDQCLRSHSIVLDVEAAKECGIITQTSDMV